MFTISNSLPHHWCRRSWIPTEHGNPFMINNYYYLVAVYCKPIKPHTAPIMTQQSLHCMLICQAEYLIKKKLNPVCNAQKRRRWAVWHLWENKSKPLYKRSLWVSQTVIINVNTSQRSTNVLHISKQQYITWHSIAADCLLKTDTLQCFSKTHTRLTAVT